MNRTRVKICGITRAEDALAAAHHGADAIGLVFYSKAPRCISLGTARQIVDCIPPFVTPVALFVDQDPEQITTITTELSIRHVQLHGMETPEFLAKLNGLTILKSIRVDKASIQDELLRWRTGIVKHRLTNLAGFVLESAGAHVGGSGIANDWVAIDDLRRQGAFDSLPSIIAAGGLTPESVAQVVRQIRPWAVDVSSGVESSLGIKSEAKIAAFMRAVREADDAGSE